MNLQHRIIIRQLGLCEYGTTFSAMAQFTRNRNENTPDEIWCLQHQPVFTLGMAGKEEHVLDAGNIAVIKTDRGGQVTYHGPGQLVIYLLLDLQRKGITVKRYVSLIEQSLMDMCASLGIDAERKTGAPGVYVADKKIAALGIRVKRGCSYHGLALNVDMDLSPFRQINPCGYPGLQVTQLKNEGGDLDVAAAFRNLLPYLMKHLDYSEMVTDQSDTQLLKSSRAA